MNTIEVICENCGGTGYVENYIGYDNNIKTCPICKGEGTIEKEITL